MIDDELREWEKEEARKARKEKMEWTIKRNATFRLPVALLNWLKDHGKQSRTIELALCEKYNLSPFDIEKRYSEEEEEFEQEIDAPKGRITLSISSDILAIMDKSVNNRSAFVDNLLRQYFFH